MPLLQLPPSTLTTNTTSLTPNSIPAQISIPKRNHRANTPARRTTSGIDLDFEEGKSRNSSSGLVWAEDYYESDTAIGSTTSNLPAEQQENKGSLPSPPPAATLSSSKNSQRSGLSGEEDSYHPKPSRSPQRSPQRTFTALLPFLSAPNATGAESPTKVDTEEGDYMATLTGDKDGIIKVADRRSGISSWFTGSSAAVQLGVPIMEQETTTTTTMSRDTSPQRSAAKLQKTMTEPPITPQKTSTGGGMFNFFSPKSPAKQTVQIPAELNDDKFLTLDINTALFPASQSGEQDPFSPAAFKNLLQNAEGLLLKLQTAYKVRTLSLHELSAEKEVMAEELEEAETRAQCLKSQLVDMAHQMSMKVTAIAELASELSMEKQARAEEKLAREQSIALVTARARNDRNVKRASKMSEMSIDTVGEDLGISSSGRRRNNRTSNGSSSDSAPESEDESVFDSESISRSRTPTSTMTTTSNASIAGTVDSIGSGVPEIMQASVGRVVPNPGHGTQRPKMTQQKSTFQKLLSGMGSTPVEEVVEEDGFGGIGMGVEGCSNCRGKDASVAWDAVGLMRAENKGLKDRVGELEIAVECALDACNGLV